MRNKKLRAIITAISYFLLVVAICYSSAHIFHSYYYEHIYVSGSSMEPTLKGAPNTGNLVGATVDFGIVDPSKGAINHIERFDIVSTYYYDDFLDEEAGTLKKGAKLKIKRIIALPKESFEIKNSLLYVFDDKDVANEIKYNFSINNGSNISCKDHEKQTLNEEEYWVLGDNRIDSNDSGVAGGKPIKKSYIRGVLVAIEGQGELYLKNFVCNNCQTAFKSLGDGVCHKCNDGNLVEKYDVKNKKYHWPKFY